MNTVSKQHKKHFKPVFKKSNSHLPSIFIFHEMNKQYNFLGSILSITMFKIFSSLSTFYMLNRYEISQRNTKTLDDTIPSISLNEAVLMTHVRLRSLYSYGIV